MRKKATPKREPATAENLRPGVWIVKANGRRFKVVGWPRVKVHDPVTGQKFDTRVKGVVEKYEVETEQIAGRRRRK